MLEGEYMKRQEKYPETECFIFDNANPKGRLTSDCYVRALTIGLGKDYAEVLGFFVGTSLKYGYSVGSKQTIEKVLQHFGYKKQKQPKHSNNTKYTGKEFCSEFNTGAYICNIGGHHITVIVDGKIHDTWDCSNKTIGNYWKID